MHFNRYFLEFLVPELREILVGQQINACFSQNKDELIIGTGGPSGERFIRANFLPSVACMDFPDTFHRGKRNTINLFSPLLEKNIEDVAAMPHERAFQLLLSGGSVLLFKLHGTRANVLFFESADAPAAQLLFRNELKEDHEVPLHHFSKELDLSREHFNALGGHAGQFLPTLGKIPRQWLKERGYPDASVDEKWELLQELLDMLSVPLFSIMQEHEDFVLSMLPVEKPLFQTSEALEACRMLFKYRVAIRAFEKERGQWIKHFQGQNKKSQAYIAKNRQRLKELVEGRSPQEEADVLMANLHQLSGNETEVRLFNFYSGQEEVFKLKQGLSPQKQAELRYKKAKNRRLEIAQIEQHVSDKEELIAQNDLFIEQLEQLEDYRSLKAFLKDNQLGSQQREQAESVPFKRFEHQGFEILVGKSAKANDELLRRYAWKEDLWLHAKDVSGSHVLIKARSGLNFPKDVLEYAAGLAAYYSKYKQESLAPIAYTPAKYVHKVKGSAPGAVRVDREKVILVQPLSPQ
ncbi:MAG: NFACT RNA binding domain-containing protein [Nitritalea sp.]